MQKNILKINKILKFPFYNNKHTIKINYQPIQNLQKNQKLIFKFSDYNKNYDNQTNNNNKFISEENNSIFAQLGLNPELQKQMKVEAYLEENINNIKCKGCGVQIQTESEDILGYIDLFKLNEILNHNINLQEKLDDLSFPVQSFQDQVQKNQESIQFEDQSTIKINGRQTTQSYLKSQMLEKNDNVKVNKQGQIEIHDLNTLIELDDTEQNYDRSKSIKKEYKLKQIKCKRCQTLTNKEEDILNNKQIHENLNKNSQDNLNLNQQQQKDKYIIQAQNINIFLEKLFDKIRHKSTIFLFVDASDIVGTLNLQVVDHTLKHGHKLIIIINKEDILDPTYTQKNLVQHSIKQYIQEQYFKVKQNPEKIIQQVNDQDQQNNQENNNNNQENQQEYWNNINPNSFIEEMFFISAKQGEGIKQIVKYIKHVKKQAISEKHARYSKNFYVIGYTNSGKSTFINQLNKSTNKYTKKEILILNQESPLKHLMGEELQGWEEQSAFDELTVSAIPNTTIDIVKIYNSALQISIYDTPGIPNYNMLTNLFTNSNHSKMLVNTKKISPRTLGLKNDLSLYFGALARIDYVSGPIEGINVITFASQNVGLHVTKQSKANEVFIKQYGKILVPVLTPNPTDVKFEKYKIQLTFNHKGVCEQDIDISGLGWISFCSNYPKQEPFEIVLYLPQGVKFGTRHSILRFNKKLLIHKIQSRSLQTKQVKKQQKQIKEQKLLSEALL